MVKFLYHIKRVLILLKNEDEYDVFLSDMIKKFYRLSPSKKMGIHLGRKRKKQLIVSLTSIPSRIETLWITVESLLRQSYKPDRIILWLAEDEFKDGSLPNELTGLQKRGLEIRYCQNLRSYKKFYYAMQEFPDSLLVTVDDDIIYTERMLEELVRLYVKYPGNIICNRSHHVKLRHNGALKSYKEWEHYNDRKIKEIPEYANFFTGCGGTLFPVQRFVPEIYNKTVFMQLAPKADDVWLNLMAWISGMKVVNTKGVDGYVITVGGTQIKSLTQINVCGGQNDKQLKAVIDWYHIQPKDYIEG